MNEICQVTNKKGLLKVNKLCLVKNISVIAKCSFIYHDDEIGL